jgi:hypothetical protein
MYLCLLNFLVSQQYRSYFCFSDDVWTSWIIGMQLGTKIVNVSPDNVIPCDLWYQRSISVNKREGRISVTLDYTEVRKCCNGYWFVTERAVRIWRTVKFVTEVSTNKMYFIYSSSVYFAPRMPLLGSFRRLQREEYKDTTLHLSDSWWWSKRAETCRGLIIDKFDVLLTVYHYVSQ